MTLEISFSQKYQMKNCAYQNFALFSLALSLSLKHAQTHTPTCTLCHLMRHFQWNSWKCMCICVSVQLLHSQTVTGMCLCKSLSESVGWIPDCVCVCVSSSQPHESKLSYICSINPSCSLAYDLPWLAYLLKWKCNITNTEPRQGGPVHTLSESLSPTHTHLYTTHISPGVAQGICWRMPKLMMSVNVSDALAYMSSLCSDIYC